MASVEDLRGVLDDKAKLLFHRDDGGIERGGGCHCCWRCLENCEEIDEVDEEEGEVVRRMRFCRNINCGE